MKNVQKSRPFLMLLTGATVLSSLALIFAGIYRGEWWGSLGFVLMMAALICTVGFFADTVSPTADSKSGEKSASHAA